MNEPFRAYWELMRLDRPIGTFLLLWPTLTALWLADHRFPDLQHCAIFIVGTFIARAMGCVINDILDRDFDQHVARTQNRPLADGRLTVIQALICLAVLIALGGLLILFLNPLTRFLALLAIPLAWIYPLMKRVIPVPQVVLGFVFSWGILMASTAVVRDVTVEVWLLFLLSFLWIVAYDTQYAMVDRDDDLKLGLKSTAIFLGKFDILAVVVLDIAVVLIAVLIGQVAGFRWFYWVGVLIASGLFVYQWTLIFGRDREKIFVAFKNNAWVGFVLFVGVVSEYPPSIHFF
ncbi:MAG: 4-hydroxybenzoate octaprenyltransferase [Gammaproteobacteria bacterium]|nr:4-hydroxybenzoate octaprenyltransferase [Gammaproteobacteria bacterium]